MAAGTASSPFAAGSRIRPSDSNVFWVVTDALETARTWFTAQPQVASVALLEDGTVELGFRGDDEATVRLLAGAVGAGLPIVSFARAASDLEELFLQVTARDSVVPVS